MSFRVLTAQHHVKFEIRPHYQVVLKPRSAEMIRLAHPFPGCYYS